MGPLQSARQRNVKARPAIAPINWMKDQMPFTIQDALNGPSSRLHITLSQVLDCSPRLCRDMAELLPSSIPRMRKKRIAKNNQAVPPASLHTSKFALGNKVTSEVSLAIDDNIECLYTDTWVGNSQISEVLVDAGAMLDLISPKLVDKLGLERYPVSGLGMRLGDDRLVALRNYVWLDVVVAGVFAWVKAYEVAVSQTYQLLLLRRWLQRHRAVEYHDLRTLFIEGSERVGGKVLGIPIGGTGIKLESLDSLPFCNMEDDEAEEGIETLLNELDHWDQKREADLILGN